MKLLLFCLLGVAAWSSAVASLGAQQQPPVIPKVTVTARRGAELDAREAPVSVTVVTREEIEASPGTTADELLRGIPGLQLPLLNSAKNCPICPSVALRGLGIGDDANRTLVLVDGVPMNGPMFGNVYWNRIPKQNIERIEIVRGGSSSVYGSFGIGGVIHIITRRPSGNVASLETRGGNYATYEASGFGSAELSERASGSVSAGYR